MAVSRWASLALALGAAEALVVRRIGLSARRRVAIARASAFEETQWSLFQESAVGRWEGEWTTYDGQGLEALSHTAVSEVALTGGGAVHALEVPGPGGYPRRLDVGSYSVGALGRQTCAASGLCTGPAVLRSGLMATELALTRGDDRLRVAFTHAPAEAKEGAAGGDADPALLCYKCVVSRERRCGAGPPARGEAAGAGGGVDFYRGDSPWSWRRTWGGASAVATGRGELTDFDLSEVEEGGGWHENLRTGEANYNLALPGCVRVHGPSVITADAPAILRVAWMPAPGELLRAEATLVALEDGGEGRYDPPRLLSFRVDDLGDRGDKAGDPVYVDPPADPPS